ncbi:MAG: hypothetical protein E6I60_16610, partial [Chloroflexi bacterium]
MNPSVLLKVTFKSTLGGTDHEVVGKWIDTSDDRVTWVGSALIDGQTATAQSGPNELTVKDGTSCVRDPDGDGSNVMDDETALFTLDFGTAEVAATGGATNVGATS